jgi:hypothetical protein
VAELKFDHLVGGHGPVQQGRARMGQFRNYIEDLTARVEKAKKAGVPLTDLQKQITAGSLATLKEQGFGDYVAENLAKHAVYIGSKTALEERLSANITAIYNNLDRT